MSVDEADGLAERFTASIGLDEDFIVARVVGELDYTSAGLLHQHDRCEPQPAVLDAAA
jgi:hypothetical protein